MTFELLITQLKDAYVRENFRRIKQIINDLETRVDDNSVSDTVINQIVNASVWQRTSGLNAPSSSTTVIDQKNINDFVSMKYVVSIRDNTANKTTAFEILITNENGTLKDSVYTKIHGGISYALNVVNNSGVLELQLTNNEANDFAVSIAKLTL